MAIANPSANSISDVDVTAANVPESIAGATVEITGGAVDNTFGTIYEKLTSGSGASVTSSLGNTIAITGSGTPSITISGAGTPTEYQNIIKAITYENANPNAYTGARTVTVMLTDSALTGGSAGTAAATTTITNLWAPVVDTNGVATTLVTINGVEQEIGAGVKYVTSYTQGGSPVKVATADATITDEDSYLKSVVVSIHDAAEGLVANDYEKLTITLGNTSNWNGMGLTVSGSGTDTITLTGNLPPSIYQLALRSISYANTAPAPGEVTRTINVVATDVDNHIGYTGHTDINVIPVNSPPTLAAVTSGSVAETALSSITTDSGLTGTLVGSDVETVAGSLVYGISGGTAGTGDDLGKVLKVGTYGTLKVTTAGGAYAYVKNSDAIDSLAQGATAHDDFTVTVSDGSLSNTSPPTNGPTRTLTINLTGANDAAIISGTSTASLTETDAALTTTGTLTSTDVDGTANLFSAQTDVAGSNGFGKFSITTGGVWTYTANNAHDEFVGSSSHTDSITVAAADGTTQVVTVTITGSNDAATFSGSSAGAVTEDSGSYSAAGTLTVSDVDSTVTVTAQDGTEGAYGSFSIGTDGAWTYTAVNSKLQALAAPRRQRPTPSV